MIPKHYYYLIALNPLTGVIHGFRYALLGESLESTVILISLCVTTVLAVVALGYFKKSERLFADFI
jgi:lipopolysaccharide transport system permease protein